MVSLEDQLTRGNGRYPFLKICFSAPRCPEQARSNLRGLGVILFFCVQKIGSLEVKSTKLVSGLHHQLP
jgi:hypothetical protein